MHKLRIPTAVTGFLILFFFALSCTKIDTTSLGKDLIPTVDNINTFDNIAQSVKNQNGGETDQNHTINADVRKDGSVMFDRQKDAYNFMYNKSKANNNREEFGAIMNNAVLVLPDGLNGSGESKVQDYGYDWRNGNLFDPVTNKVDDIIATIHTHLSRSNGDPTPSFTDKANDVYTFTYNTPNKPFLTMGWDGKLYGDYGSWLPGKDGRYHTGEINYSIIRFDSFNITNKTILDGGDLIDFLKRYMKAVLKK